MEGKQVESEESHFAELRKLNIDIWQQKTAFVRN